jgi:4-hydroxyphenylpyruvate dioxygenase
MWTSTPANAAGLVGDAGLAIVAFKPFRDFEGMPEPQRSRGFERAKRKFALMNELAATATAGSRRCYGRRAGR